ncbi:T cell receptor alpha variable 3 [Merluccius polli]|nr:T cell receptor alpha variable 3 [Merluccius polli]
MPICFGTNKISTTSPGSFCHPFTYGGGLNAAEFNKDRFDAQIQNTSVPLRIQNLQLSDSALYYCGASYQQTIHSIQDRVQALQGDKVTLSCNYSSADSFFWYLQYPSSPPQFLIKEYDKPTRFTLKKDEGRQMFHLEISSVVVTDSALYYCAVRPTCKGEDRVIQTRQDVIATEGHTVSLGCTFETTDTNAYLFWYKQDFNDFPRFILSPFYFNKDRFDAQIQNTSVPLRIQNLQLSDSALYYCGLRPTVTGNTDSLYQQTIHSIQDRVQALQGDKVTLSCNYSSADSFFWYLQYPSSPPQFLIKEYDKPTRFTLKKDEGRQMFHLEISSVVVTDSALYYCAVRPTVTGNTDSLYKNLTAIQSRYERLIHSLISIFCSSLECKGEDRVIQTRQDVIATEGHTVSLGCTFETTDTNAKLFWYKQDINDFPRFILSRFTYGEGLNAAEFNKDRFDAQIQNTSVPLRIQNLQLSDSALYYCGDSYQQTVHSIQDRVQALQGDKVTLSCNYSSATYFFWYLQYPSSHPQFLIKEYDKPTRFTLKKDEERQMFHLEISSAEVTDSALYYCAVRSTVTGNTDSLYKNLTAIQSRYEHLIHSLISIFCSSPECKGEDRVIQTRQDVIATEGHTVRIDCTFETTDTSLYLFWYKQDINDFPRFILSRFTYGEGLNAAEFNKDRFDAQIQNTSVPLRIQNLQLSDSALYYCGDSYQQTVHSIQDRVQALQGDKVTLSCNYSSADYFFWYLQYPSSPPQLLIKEYKELSGFTLKKDKEMFHLEISSAVVTDSALYYCAVRPTVTGNTDSLYKNLTRNLKSICHRLNRGFGEGHLERLTRSLVKTQYVKTEIQR